MVSEQQSNSLLHALKQLYSRVALYVVHKRMVSYRKEAGSHASQDLVTPLSDHLEKLASSRQPDQGGVPRKSFWRGFRSTRQRYPPGSSFPAAQVSAVDRALGSLARYFRVRRASAVVDRQMSEKLKKSTLNHIHTALRVARQGDITSARLHADIASHALHEAVHYMTEKEYAEFSLEVDEKLGEIQKQNRP